MHPLSDPESLLEVEMDSSTLAELNTQIESSDETVTIDTTSIAVADTGKLADTLTDAEKGALERKLMKLLHRHPRQLLLKTHQLERKSRLQDFRNTSWRLVSQSFSISSRQHNSGCCSSKVPSDVDEGDLPGKSTFGDRSIRHFLVKGSSSSSAPSSGDFSSATEVKCWNNQSDHSALKLHDVRSQHR